MKYIRKTVFALALTSLAMTQTGCFGTFALTRKAYEFHDGLTDSKFLKSLLFWIPGGFVYGIVGFIDVIILNLIEFWSGSNPLSMNEGDYEMQLATVEGEQFRIEATKDTFTTTQLSGEKAGEVRVMKFDRSDKTWKYTDSHAKDVAVMSFLGDDAENVRVYTATGSVDMPTADLASADAIATHMEGMALAK